MARIALAILLAASTARADCRQFFVQRQVAYAAPVYYAQAYYQVGRDLEAEALAEKVARLAAPKVAALVAQQLNAQQQQRVAASVLAQNCARCHSGATPKAGLIFDGLTPVPDEHFRRTVEIIGAGVDVPPEMQKLVANLTAEAKGKILDELVALKPQATERLPPPAPNDLE